MKPALSFFSGGTALRALSRHMARRGIPSAHFISTFDSGGSSAALRKAFAMPAVGDMRNRLLALSRAPESVLAFCNYRLPQNRPRSDLLRQLARIASPVNEAFTLMPVQTARVFQDALAVFLARMGDAFEPAGASIGNLIITGLYFRHKRDFGPALALLHSVLETRGDVLPITSANAHLAARLADGSLTVGQHLFSRLGAPVRKLFLTVHESGRAPRWDDSCCRPPITPEILPRIAQSRVICYPPGSFFSSVLANLLTRGAGEAIAASVGAKVFVPNSGHDPEAASLTVAQQAELILQTLLADAPRASRRELLQYVVIDSLHGRYPGGLGPAVLAALQQLGLVVIDRPVVREANPGEHVPEELLAVLLGLAGACA